MVKKKAIIVDVDDTLTLEPFYDDLPQNSNREEWDLYHQRRNFYSPDLYKPLYNMIEMIQGYIENNGTSSVIFLTSREDTHNGVIRENTLKFINNVFRFTKFWDKLDIQLFMRKENDFSPSPLVKEQYLINEILPNYSVELAIDDDSSNCEMFEKYNILAIQPHVKGLKKCLKK